MHPPLCAFNSIGQCLSVTHDLTFAWPSGNLQLGVTAFGSEKLAARCEGPAIRGTQRLARCSTAFHVALLILIYPQELQKYKVGRDKENIYCLMAECCIQYRKAWCRDKGKSKILSIIRLGFRNTDKGTSCDNQPMFIMFSVRDNHKRLSSFWYEFFIQSENSDLF